MTRQGQYAHISFCFMNGVSGTITDKKEIKKKARKVERLKRQEQDQERKFTQICEHISNQMVKLEKASQDFDAMIFDVKELQIPILNHPNSLNLWYDFLKIDKDPWSRMEEYYQDESLFEKIDDVSENEEPSKIDISVPEEDEPDEE